MQWFTTELTQFPRKHFAIFGNIFDCHEQEIMTRQQRPGMPLNILQFTGCIHLTMFPLIHTHTEDYPFKNINSADTETLHIQDNLSAITLSVTSRAGINIFIEGIHYLFKIYLEIYFLKVCHKLLLFILYILWLVMFTSMKLLKPILVNIDILQQNGQSYIYLSRYISPFI